ncbi:hypothetical protein BDN70DRAFT_937697 [Pholiota conissans]|uniref:Uncharacterized protein n=1 Tax=Pholiota conissans TaxID=109636 RepID=A0A9P6CN48_9AGAR|nr:hypothetical protein BDN70DRAFT_937697 [Pholiota conissans]
MANRKKSQKSKNAHSDTEVVVKPNASTEEIRAATRKAFMGLAIINVATNDDLHRGPHLTACTINSRPVSKKRRDDFIRAVGGDPFDPTKPLTDLSPLVPEHAIVVLVERRFVDDASLVKNPLDFHALNDLQRVQWTDKENFSLSKGTIANGNGRIDFCRHVLVPQLNAERLQIEKALERKPRLQEAMELKDKLKEVKIALDARASWLVAFYDLDMIDGSSHERQIKLALASNTPIYQVPDSEDEAMSLILSNIGDLPPEERLANLKSHSSLTLIACGPKRLASVVNNKAMMVQVINLYRYSKLWAAGGFYTNQLYSWRTAVSPFFEAIVNQGIHLLDYLTTDVEVPHLEKGCIPSTPDIHPHPDILDAEFFEIVSSCYAHHLYSCRDSYGVPTEFAETGRTSYQQAYAEYSTNVQKQIGVWCQERLNRIQHIPNQAEVSNIYRHMPERLAYALEHGFFNKEEFGLCLPHHFPLLCKFFVIDICDMLAKYCYAVMEIFRMLDPFFCGILIDSKRETEFKDQPTEMLCAWVRRQAAEHPEMCVINRILSVIMRHRTRALIKMDATDLGKPPRYPPRNSLYAIKIPKDSDDEGSDAEKSTPIWTREYHDLVNLMRAWRAREADEAGVKIFTDYPALKYRPKLEAGKLETAEHGLRLLEMLNATALHWASSSASQSLSHFRTLAGYMINSLWVYTHHGRRYLETNEVWDLREELRTYLEGDMMSFCGYWDCVYKQVGGRKDPLTQTDDDIPHKLVLENVMKKMEGKTHALVNGLAHQLLHRDLGAIPLKDGGLGLEKRVHQAAIALFTEIAVASWKARTMYMDVQMNRMKSVKKEDQLLLLEELSIPDTFVCASKEETKAYYKSLNKEELGKIEASGAGSKREQAKIARAQEKLRKMIERRDRILGVISPEEVGLEHLLEEAGELHKIEQEDEDDALIKQQPNSPSPSQQHLSLRSIESGVEDDSDSSSDQEECSEGDASGGEEDLNEENSDIEDSDEESSDGEDSEDQGLERKRKRANSEASSEHHKRRNCTDRRSQQSGEEDNALITPVSHEVGGDVPPDAPKGRRVGQAEEKTPEATFPMANPPPPRDSTPDYPIDDGLDEDTMIEMASFADHMEVTPAQLFKDVVEKDAGIMPWTSSPAAIVPVSSTPPVRKRDLRLRQRK